MTDRILDYKTSLVSSGHKSRDELPLEMIDLLEEHEADSSTDFFFEEETRFQ